MWGGWELIRLHGVDRSHIQDKKRKSITIFSWFYFTNIIIYYFNYYGRDNKCSINVHTLMYSISLIFCKPFTDRIMLISIYYQLWYINAHSLFIHSPEQYVTDFGNEFIEIFKHGCIEIFIERCQWYIIILRKSWRVFHDKFTHREMLLGFCLASFGILFCSVVFGCRYTPWTMDRVVSGACFIAGGVLNCDLSHCRSVAVLCMLYKIRCNSKHPLCCALPVPYVPVRVTRGALIAHRYTVAPPRCRTSQDRRTFIPLSESLWNDLVDPVFNGVGLLGFKSRSIAFLLA